jgi:hypothetical protein
MIDLDTLHETHHGSRFDRMVALLLGIIAVLAAALGLVQMDASMRESRATAGAARLTAELSAGLPVRGVVDTFGAQAVLAAIREMAQGTAQQLVGLGHDDATMQATGAARQAAGERLMTIAGAMSALPTGGLPAYELGLVAADDDQLQAQLLEENRLVDEAIPDASNDSARSVAGLSVLALAGVLVGLASVLGADRAGRVTLVVAWVAAGAAAGALVWSLL